MLRRFVSLSVGALALLVVLGAPGQLHAQRFRGGFRPGFMPGFRGGLTPGFNRFGPRRFDRFEDRFERRFGRGPFVSPFSPGLGSVFFPPF